MTQKKFDKNQLYLFLSALQKSIRWCEVNASRYFAQQLMNMGVPDVLFNRLMIIAAEDVGLADPSLIGYERQCYNDFNELLLFQICLWISKVFIKTCSDVRKQYRIIFS